MTLILARNPLSASEAGFVRGVLKTAGDSALVLIGPSPRWDAVKGERVYRVSNAPADHPTLSWADLYDVIRRSDRILTVS